jgi:hypothetical protein
MSGTVRIEGDTLVLELHGVDKILAFQSTVRIPLKHIVSVSTERVPWLKNESKMPGTNIPGLVKDGHYSASDGWVFYEMRNPDKCITLNLNDDEYKRVVFQVEDKESSATLIRQVIA